MDDKLRDTFSKLRRCGEQGLRLAEVESPERGPVNWSDLSIVECGLIMTDDDSQRYFVLIEEASPDATWLQQFMWRHFKLNGFEDVEIRTEW